MRITRIPQLQGISTDNPADLSRIDYLIRKYRHKKGSIIPLLQGAQEIYGFIPRGVFEKYNQELGLSLSEMYGVATFYAQFRLAPVGKHIIKVCHGTACHVQNAGAITDALKEALKVNDGETTEDRMFTLESVACLGCCSLAPVMMIGNDTFGKLTGSEAVKVIKEIRLRESN
jgi:NADH-quinone oxidoreductase subunit E